MILHIAVIFGFGCIYSKLEFGSAFTLGGLTYVLLSWGLRFWFTRKHRSGMNHVREGKWEIAIPYFQQSLDYFTENRWMDKYRSIVLLTPSAMSYREMAMVNIAFCLGQLGQGRASREAYERALKEYPGSVIASTALNLMKAASSAT